MFKDVAEIKAEIEKQLSELGITEEYSASEEEREESEKQEEGAVVSAIEASRKELASISRSVVSLLEKELPETEVNIDLSPVIDSLKKIEKTIEKYKPQEIRDYSDLLKQLLAVSGKKESVDLSPVVDALDRLANKKETVFTIPKELITKDNRIRVEVDRAGSTGHRSTLSSTESAKLLTLATEAKQDDIIAALGGGVKIKKIDEALPYTYIGEAAVGTATSAAAWSIKRVDDTNDPDSTILYAGTGAYDQIWDNRVGLTYN